MSTYRLDKLFSPRSVAVVGASPRETSPGRAVLRNLGSAGFEGSVSLVNPHYGEIEGIKAVKTIQALRQTPDLLVIATPPHLDAPACCGCSISTSCSRRPRRSDGYGRFPASGWRY